MADQRMSLDSELLTATVRQISDDISDINLRCNKFLALVEETNMKTDNRFALTKQLVPVLQAESAKIQETIKVVGTIEDATKRYIQLAEEASDTSFLQMN